MIRLTMRREAGILEGWIGGEGLERERLGREGLKLKGFVLGFSLT
jgi:hypothetical protein